MLNKKQIPQVVKGVHPRNDTCTTFFRNLLAPEGTL